MTQLLVSVRSAMEAEAALRGGAALIDVKEPARGSLGRADDKVVADVVRTVAGRRPVSAALGEWRDGCGGKLPSVAGQLSYVKWGLAGCEGGDWQGELTEAIRRLHEERPSCKAVMVAYADRQRAESPRPEEVCAFAIERAAGALLLDTWHKDGSTLLDWLSLDAIAPFCRRCRDAGLPIALAGSLGLAEIRALLPMRPDWFAVRGAACQQGQREAAIEEDKVRQLVEIISPAMSAN